MSYTVGLVGKPSVGESTLCNAAMMNDLPEGATAGGFRHGHDARSGRRVGSAHGLAHRDVVGVATT